MVKRGKLGINFFTNFFSKKAQMKMSFGMIFSLILIIAFLAFAFYAIKLFLGTGLTAQVAQFENNLQTDVDKLWRSSSGSQEKDYVLPGKIEYVCFADFNSEETGAYSSIYEEMQFYYMGTENLFLYPNNGFDGFTLEHLDINGITLNQNPYCVEVVDSHLKLILSKDFNETLVTITK